MQWDTISLLSLLEVHVVLAYYNDATKNTKRNDQITGQKFDNNYILARLNEVFNFKGAAREWNERETKELKNVFEKAKLAYREISKTTKTYLHDETALDELIKFTETPQKFIEFSRSKSQKAQKREFQTKQPKEALVTNTKERITITNALLGKYFFTVDETRLEPKTVYLIEAKHSERSRLTNESDIKDALIKMMVYTNLRNVRVSNEKRDFRVVLKLTSSKLNGSIDSAASDEDLTKYCSDNLLDSSQREFLKKLFAEGRQNKFTVIVEKAETIK